MLDKERIIQAFKMLGLEFMAMESEDHGGRVDPIWKEMITRAGIENPWFIPEFVKEALIRIGSSLSGDKLEVWTSQYPFESEERGQPLTIGVVMAGNVPLVGFHDFISVLISGNRFFGKLSSDDRILLPFLAKKLAGFFPAMDSYMLFTEGRLEGFDAVIATGSNNTSRYFDYYFGKYPHIIRKNRNGVAVLSGKEKGEELRRLAGDVFLYFGLGCRNVSKLFVPRGYDFAPLMEAFGMYGPACANHKYMNNYDYYKSIYLINSQHHYDNGFVLITRSDAISSPPSVLYYEEYDDVTELNGRLIERKGQIQCIVSGNTAINGAVPFGMAQQPELWDYADGIDTLDFLLGLE